MARFILLLACIAVLLLGGGMVKAGMALAAAAFLLLVGFVAHLLLRLFMGPPVSERVNEPRP